MKLALRERETDASVVVLTARVPACGCEVAASYRTQTGALVRVDGRAAGAFDREHRELVLPAAPRERELRLEVERRSLPTNGLPPGPGLRWWWLNVRASARPRRTIGLVPARGTAAPAMPPAQALPLWGHSHLDVAWLWTYDAAARKAMRTFAGAVALLDSDPGFVFAQSQPQLYEFVREGDPELFARIQSLARAGRFDPGVAAMWVEPDCNIPSGESLLRQMLAAHRFCAEFFGIEPSIAWLPDTFGFSRTLPSLLAHAGIRYFATTKLQWNDTTRFAHPQFRWRGPDGAEITSALIDSMDRGFEPARVETARARGEPLVVGYGDGGGGPTREQLRAARAAGRWERPRAWFERLEARRGSLPLHDDELYLQYHRGVYTTHHDVKAHNAALERKLATAEEQASWCVAVRMPAAHLARVREALREAWRIVLRNQFHDVLPGTSIAEVYDDARAEYARAHELVDGALAASRAMLPHPARGAPSLQLCAPVEHDAGYEFRNDLIRARVLSRGTLVELAATGGTNAVAQANAIAHYRDRPKRWEAWNIDAGYQRSRKAARPQPPRLAGGALEIPFLAGASPATMRLSLAQGEPFLRVDLAIDWRERRRLLRVESWLTTPTDEVTYGAPHGVVTRSARADTSERRAQFEVPGQRFALVRDGQGSGLALFALDTYGWNARALGGGGVQLGHSLLRSTAWPDRNADAGEQHLSWAFAPLHGAGIGDVERAWLQFACERSVPLFRSEDDALLIAACKPAEDGDGVIVRVRECEGAARTVSVRCGGRMRGVQPVDGLERPSGGDARIEGESIAGAIGAFGLRSFRVRF